MRQSDPPVSYLVGTPKGRLTKLEKPLLEKSWHHARTHVKVKLLDHEGEAYVYAQSENRVAKERSMRRRRLRKYLKELKAIQERKRPLKRDALHQAFGAAKKQAGRDARHLIVEITLHGKGEDQTATVNYRLDRKKLRLARRREGRYCRREGFRPPGRPREGVPW
jgi:hypothetical protein